MVVNSKLGRGRRPGLVRRSGSGGTVAARAYAAAAMGLLVGNVIRHAAGVVPDRLAATMADEELTFGELEERSNRVARAFAARGVGLGDRVAWWGETGLAAMPIFGALAKLGAAFMPVNARLGADEAEEVVGYAKPALIVVDESHGHAAFEAVPQAQLFAEADGHGGGDVVEPGLEERAPHVVFFTSGSTGRSKGVVLSHRASFLRSFPNLITDWTGGTVCMFPLFHMSGWSMTLNAWQMRLPVHFAPADAEVLLATAERRRASRLYCLPAVWSRVLEHDWSRFDLTGVRECDTGTSATPPELLAAIKDAFPETVTRIYYGSTEAGPATLLGDADLLRKPGSVGLPAPGVDLRLADDGEVCTPPPRRCATAGTTRGTWGCSTTTATCRSSAGPATCCAPAARPSPPGRSRRSSRPTPRSPRSPWSGSPTCSGVRSSARSWCPCTTGRGS